MSQPPLILLFYTFGENQAFP